MLFFASHSVVILAQNRELFKYVSKQSHPAKRLPVFGRTYASCISQADIKFKYEKLL
jgi:hypothetical protein